MAEKPQASRSDPAIAGMEKDLESIEPALEVFQKISRTLDLEETLDAVLEGAARLFGYSAAGIYVVKRESGRLVAHRTRGGKRPSSWMSSALDDEGIVRRLLSSAEPILSAEGGAVSFGEKDRESGGLMAVPVLGARKEARGALVLEAEAGQLYRRSSLRLLASYASGIAAAIERAMLYSLTEDERHIESELAVARRVMSGLLPRSTPALEGFEIAVVIEPWYEVGGDYYDFIPLGNDRWAIAVADVAGKGIPAALLVAALRASLYSLAGQELALRALFNRANRFFHEAAGKEGTFVTLFYAVMDLRARRLIYVNAGHLPPILLRSEGRFELLEEGGVPIGPFDRARYFEEFAKLGTGDLIALYTDGITEAMDEEENSFGLERLVEVLRETRSRPAAEICEAVMKAVKSFSGSQPADDQTILVLKAT